MGRKVVWGEIRKDRSIQIPDDYLEAMGLSAGEQVQLVLDGDVVCVLSKSTALQEVRDMVRRQVPEGVKLVDELLEERRAEVREEKMT